MQLLQRKMQLRALCLVRDHARNQLPLALRISLAVQLRRLLCLAESAAQTCSDLQSGASAGRER